MPRTVEAWQLQGTTSLMLFDRKGVMRARHFGQVSGLALGAEVMRQISEDADDA